MSDEFFEDDFEDMLFDPTDDFQDDLVDEEYDEAEDVGRDHQQDIDFGDAFVFGTMVGGIASDEQAEERLRKKLIEENDRNKLVDEE